MEFSNLVLLAAMLSPLLLMAMLSLGCMNRSIDSKTLWKAFSGFTVLALVATIASAILQAFFSSPASPGTTVPGLQATPIQAWMAILVQFLGTVIGLFSSRYLNGEQGQAQFIRAFSGVLATVHLLLLADHWLVLIAAWALIGFFLEQLLCFYPERPFAMLAAHKKHIADRIADVLLIAAAALAWWQTGSGALSDLFAYVADNEISLALQLSAVFLVLAVVIRTAIFPVHGWLIQVMEAPTPVSALLHAGVVNLSGFVLIRFAPMLEASAAARWLLVTFGLLTALLAGLVMLTRISIKVRLAWSTVAQMGFMILECGLGLYTLAAMHLLGHSLYKAHAFLSASSIVQQNKLQQLRGPGVISPISLLLAPAIAIGSIMLVQYVMAPAAWPWWWNAILALAWAPLLWIDTSAGQPLRRVLSGAGMIAALALIASLLHHLPFGTSDNADIQTGLFALFGMGLLYLAIAAIHVYPKQLAIFQRWGYAGFYVDEAYTRLTLKLWPIDWASAEKLQAKS